MSIVLNWKFLLNHSRVSSSYFFLFFPMFWPVPIFSNFYKKTSYFSYFLTVGAMQLVNLASIFSPFCYLFVLIRFVFILAYYLQHT